MATRAQQQAEQQKAAQQRRHARHKPASLLWELPLAGPATRKVQAHATQWAAMRIAAFLLDDCQPTDRKDAELADWLLCARPEFAKDVAAGVAAIALREGRSEVWDALAAVDAMDIVKATELYDVEGALEWSPRVEWLTPEPADV